jgi:hypothetical protein
MRSRRSLGTRTSRRRHDWRGISDVDWNRERAGAPLAVEVPEITLMIKEVRVFDSMVAIYKTQQRHLPRSVAY